MPSGISRTELQERRHRHQLAPRTLGTEQKERRHRNQLAPRTLGTPHRIAREASQEPTCAAHPGHTAQPPPRTSGAPAPAKPHFGHLQDPAASGHAPGHAHGHLLMHAPRGKPCTGGPTQLMNHIRSCACSLDFEHIRILARHEQRHCFRSQLAYSSACSGIALIGVCRQKDTVTWAKPNLETVPLADPSHHNIVSILNELALGAIWHVHLHQNPNEAACIQLSPV